MPQQTHFNPRSPHGERQNDDWSSGKHIYFNPRSPHGERHLRHLLPPSAAVNFNPRSPHGERPGMNKPDARVQNFNPRSPHGERLEAEIPGINALLISIHAPRTGSDSTEEWRSALEALFQSTLPARGATSNQQRQGLVARNFNPRSPHGERLISAGTE